VARQLASLDQRGWWFVVIISVINLIYLVLVVLGPAPMQAVWWGIVINAIALILALLPSTQVAFGRQPGRTA
jgi:tetrahydromethanopterin S-methyltransferase subunit E